MDDRRFDSLVKAAASGASRRSILKGVLGLGGAAVVGGAALDRDADAARRPSPTPKPATCPGNQIPGPSGICTCPGTAPYKCGPDCCTGQVADSYPRAAGHSECCDNACCFGTCYGEELCCPTNMRGHAWDPDPPIASVCDNGECCFLPNVCIDGVCGLPFWCENNDDCGDCETCNPETGQCSSLCTDDLPQCCVNGFGEYCVPAGERCCSSADDCTEPCSYCNDVVRYCVDRCEGAGNCCEGANGDECCAADRCIAGQGCCDEGYIACGGRCCRADVYFCNEQDDCACLPGTEPCGQLPGGCCPDGQCNADGECCVEGTTACGTSCCDNATEICDPSSSTCVCASGTIECNGSCIDGVCCDGDTQACVDLYGYSRHCVQCSGGSCETAPLDFNTCNAARGWCSNGECLACLFYPASCTHGNQCCTGLCAGNQCYVN